MNPEANTTDTSGAINVLNRLALRGQRWRQRRRLDEETNDGRRPEAVDGPVGNQASDEGSDCES